MHNKLRSDQRGLTAISWIVILAALGVVVILTLRLVPNYLEYYKVAQVLESLNNEPGLTDKSKAEILKLIERRFDVNDVRNVTRDDVVIDKDEGGVTISIDYEVRTHALGNVDVVTVFHKQVQVIRH